MSMLVKGDSLKITGATKQFTRFGESGNEVISFFCPECGVQIYAFSKLANGLLTPGTLDDTSWLRPTAFVWMKSAQSWVPVPDGVRDFDRGHTG
jgi:hypothetical protein